MKVLIYSAKDFEIPFLEKANQDQFQIKYTPERLTLKTATKAMGFDAISIFSSDDGSSQVLERLKDFGIKYITMRSTGYDHVNLKIADTLGIHVANAPDYSPEAIAEHAIALLLGLQRKVCIADNQVKNYNFALDNLVGSNISQKNIGIIGTGKIGSVITRIMHGFNSKIWAYDRYTDSTLIEAYNVFYTTLEDLCRQSDIIFLSIPLNNSTHHLIDQKLLNEMKSHCTLINIARGAVVNTKDVISALEHKKIASYGADVYEGEKGVFFYNHSKDKVEDEVLKKLIELPNVLLTPHQAFATTEALTNIAETTFFTIRCWAKQITPDNELTNRLLV